MSVSDGGDDDPVDFLMELLTYECPNGKKRAAGCLEERTAKYEAKHVWRYLEVNLKRKIMC